VLWPLDWSAEQWAQKKEKHTWLFCKNGLLGCKTCFEVSCLKTFKSRDFEISKEWSSCQISGGTSKKIQFTKFGMKYLLNLFSAYFDYFGFKSNIFKIKSHFVI